ncbi:MAG: ABC transporter related protein [Candidatus Gottesmanbacteria bacterium GW2011_GWB1_43_11]|uniref:ABC transporter related protein n=1 Tax=Candidatus Gottesmanbacteria bacterium GW2011_GWB1_43_11 TaxID=1618446 RepID=A0A0G1FJ10_9BACT|nr:MAG: ABC transporter related protein [Candidatus Gottesmanbacteria bacterium GW2011_GWA1_42_26]KKS81907.1 MAG: ABC transporter-like protein, ABC-2 type transport system ATP-binding protein [Candidatus Gottesmanbacteria bacterium GW2011_GWC1_43_10]KKS86828.1 MAG: ABC transporter related protein [Candidatus Gottesmanbacteria bacterium GW2011_GWB1_43_11]OGG10517.1 MAG: ABC transporter [Candidatus Gottesmanbacteria bacterium RIFCSPHIGHO2_01_FULL_43_15]
MVISVSHLSKTYRVAQKEPGFLGTLNSFFNRQYKEVHAVSDVSFAIGEGELVGFIGPNGAGKTTTLKCLSGLLYPTSGHVSVLGFTPFERKNTCLKQISLVMGQKNQLWWDLPAEDTFLLNKEIYEISDEVYKKTLHELVELLDVADVLKTQVRKLSLGQRMKMELIAALIHKPKVLFLDEPTIGLDVIMQQKMREFIREYNRRHKSTILLTSHYMEDVKELCKRVIIIDHGKIIYDGLLGDIVKKLATHKKITVIFESDVDPKQLDAIGEIKEYNFPKVVISVERGASNVAAAELLQKFPVADINIEEPDIEDIIRQVFKGKELV